MAESASKILFVDDETQFLQLAKRIFENENYKILTAENGKDAIEIFKKNLPIPIVVADFRMPGMNGDELVEKLQEISPHTKVIIVSAHSDANDACGKVPAGHILCVIPKPVKFEYLKETVKSALKSSQ